MEIWKDIPGYEGLYQVSDKGRIKSLSRFVKYYRGERLKKEIILKQEIVLNTGYSQVRLYNQSNEKKSKMYRVHRLVLFSFYGESIFECNHKNGIKIDNRLENLEYCTKSENQMHAIKTGLKKIMFGENSTNAKLTKDQVIRIKTIDKNCKVEKGYWAKVAKSLNIDRKNINHILNLKTWKNVIV
ncbi:MAG TPA: HNH endonuclease [Fibrobacteres bacterium]|jgi:hypothetical protein|nr:HNH endonuclease [Fibrobacterota bacterium]